MNEMRHYIAELIAAGCAPDVAAAVVAELFDLARAAARRRDWEREYRRRKREARAEPTVASESYPPASTRIHPHPPVSTGHSAQASTGSMTMVEPTDPRQELFSRGRAILQRITGRTEASCRSLIGRWLREVDDEAVHVLCAIEDAERSGPLADPTAWISAKLRPYRRDRHGENRSIPAAAERLADAAERGEFGFGPRPQLVHPAPGANDVRVLPAQRKL